MSFPLRDVAGDFHASARQYDPKSMHEYAADMQELPDAILELADGLKAMTSSAHDRLALEPGVVAALAQVHEALRGCIGPAGDVYAAIRALHEADLARQENPRNGVEAEARWNVA